MSAAVAGTTFRPTPTYTTLRDVTAPVNDEKSFTSDDYRTNPPTSGSHDPARYEEAIYAPGTTPELGKLVHALEHGRVNVEYKPGMAARDVATLEMLYTRGTAGTTCCSMRTARKCPTPSQPRPGRGSWRVPR
jgi:hypothetical protein